jgi:hypothetical protein
MRWRGRLQGFAKKGRRQRSKSSSSSRDEKEDRLWYNSISLAKALHVHSSQDGDCGPCRAWWDSGSSPNKLGSLLRQRWMSDDKETLFWELCTLETSKLKRSTLLRILPSRDIRPKHHLTNICRTIMHLRDPDRSPTKSANSTQRL